MAVFARERALYSAQRKAKLFDLLKETESTWVTRAMVAGFDHAQETRFARRQVTVFGKVLVGGLPRAKVKRFAPGWEIVLARVRLVVECGRRPAAAFAVAPETRLGIVRWWEGKSARWSVEMLGLVPEAGSTME